MALSTSSTKAQLLILPACSRGLSVAVTCCGGSVNGNERELLRKRRRGPYLLTTGTGFFENVRYFHHQKPSNLYIQLSGKVLFEALQKQHKVKLPKSVVEEFEKHHFNIPEELRRLKQGSLNWLFEVWPGSNYEKKNSSALNVIKGALQQEIEGGNDDKDSDNDEMKKMVKKTERVLLSASEKQLHDVLDYLKSRNFAIRRLVRLPWLLTCDPVEIEEGVKRVRRYLNLKEFLLAVSFVKMNSSKLGEAGILWRREKMDAGFQNRIEWIAPKVGCLPEDVADMMARFPNLMVISLEHIEQVLEIIKERQVRSEWIVNDPWVLMGSIKTVTGRAEYLKEKGVSGVKPWVFRCSKRILDNFLQRRLEQRQLLGEHKDIYGFLKEKLGGTDATVEEMMQRVPGLRAATVIKLNEMIEFLLQAGFTAKQIRETPRILPHSVKTVCRRLEEVSSINKEVINLHLLCRTSKDYRAILRNLVREQKSRQAIMAKTARNKVACQQ